MVFAQNKFQYIVINPIYQHKGYGESALKELLQNPEKYIKIKPTEIFSYIEVSNIDSICLYKKFGFSFGGLHENNYLKATKVTLNLEKDF